MVDPLLAYVLLLLVADLWWLCVVLADDEPRDEQ